MYAGARCTPRVHMANSDNCVPLSNAKDFSTANGTATSKRYSRCDVNPFTAKHALNETSCGSRLRVLACEHENEKEASTLMGTGIEGR